MPDIKDSIGEGGKNSPHDVALVQAMLRVVKNAKGQAYLGGNYDGVYGKVTKGAITSFQIDNKLAVDPAAKEAAAGAPLDKFGLVDKNSSTLKALVASLPASHSAMMIFENTKTVYLAATDQETKDSISDIHGSDLEPAFRGKVVELVQKVYDQYKMVLSIAGANGARRKFDAQLAIWNKGPQINPATGKKFNPTEAGPGESNHNFGQAVDTGPNGVQWLHGDGTPEMKEDWWLNKLATAHKNKYGAFYGAVIKARDAIATGLGLHRIIVNGKKEDEPHLQAFGGANYPRSLVKLLNAVGKITWNPGAAGAVLVQKTIAWKEDGHKAEGVHLHANVYQSDLGEGSTGLFKVGSAAKIFQGQAAVDKQMIADARSDKLKQDHLKKFGKLAGFKALQAKDIKDDEVKALKKALQKAFQTAEAKWPNWVAVP